MENTIAAQLRQHPEWRAPAHHLEMARWLNEQLDEGASWVIDDVDAFVEAFKQELWLARLELPASAEGLAGYPDWDLRALRLPHLEGQKLVFYVQRHDSRLPLKATVSLVPPHLPALYEPVPRLLGVDAALSGFSHQVRP